MILTNTHKYRTSTFVVALTLLAACSPQSEADENQAATGTPSAQQRPSEAVDSYHLPRDLEIELALSSLPRHLRNQATVYVLNPAKGFELARQGSNGFHAFVARTGDDTFHGSWPLTLYSNDIIYPVSFDEAGAKANMRVYFDAAELQAKGTPADELKRLIQERYRTGYYKPPERAGLSYMLSPILRTYTDPLKSGAVETSNNPHVMYFMPNVANQDIGGDQTGVGPLPFITQPGPHAFAVQHIGDKERAQITEEYAPMLERLCQLNRLWCLPTSDMGH